jgi:hypothetical protein
VGSIVGLLAVAFVVLLVVEFGVQLLVATDLSEPVARLQTWSLLTGTGYTTRESELVVNHPIRRRLATLVMLTGALGVVGLLASVVGGFVGADGFDEFILRLGIVVAVVAVQAYLVRTRPFRSLLRAFVRRRMAVWEKQGVTSVPLVELGQGRSVTAAAVAQGSPLTGRTIGSVVMASPHVTVLGLRRGEETYLPDPAAEVTLKAGDVLILHGPRDALASLASDLGPQPGSG